jgi:hypothetical protein
MFLWQITWDIYIYIYIYVIGRPDFVDKFRIILKDKIYDNEYSKDYFMIILYS